MAFARWGQEGSSVYCWASVYGGYTCSVCSLRDGGDWRCDTADELREHLHEHRDAGDVVPDSTFERLAAWEEEEE